MKDWLKDYFYYTKSERNGAFVLVALILVLALLPRLFPLLFPPAPTNLEGFRTALDRIADGSKAGLEKAEEPTLFHFDPNTLPLDSLQLLGISRKTATTIVRFREKVRPFRDPADLTDIYTLSQADYDRIAPYVRIMEKPQTDETVPLSKQQKTRLQPFPFDPNTLPGDSLELLGLSSRIVSTILNYRSKGGQFRKPADLKKIYGLPAEQAEALLPYVTLAKEPDNNPAHPSTALPDTPAAPALIPKEPKAIDINTATPEEWQSFRGIGPAYARRICSFRSKLGGFASVDQVGETYGLPDSTFQRIRPRLKTGTPPHRMRINHLSAAELQAHPYLTWKYANAIIAYRGQHGPFQSAGDVAKIRAIPPPVLEKMTPYWSFE